MFCAENRDVKTVGDATLIDMASELQVLDVPAAGLYYEITSRRSVNEAQQ